MTRIARIPSLGLLLVAAALVGCSESPATPSALDVTGSVAARGANVGVMTGSWTGAVGTGSASATLVETGSRISGSLDITYVLDGPTTRYAAEGIENKGQVYLNLFDGVNLPQPIVGSVSVTSTGTSFSGTLNGSVKVKLGK